MTAPNKHSGAAHATVILIRKILAQEREGRAEGSPAGINASVGLAPDVVCSTHFRRHAVGS